MNNTTLPQYCPRANFFYFDHTHPKINRPLETESHFAIGVLNTFFFPLSIEDPCNYHYSKTYFTTLTIMFISAIISRLNDKSGRYVMYFWTLLGVIHTAAIYMNIFTYYLPCVAHGCTPYQIFEDMLVNQPICFWSSDFIMAVVHFPASVYFVHRRVGLSKGDLLFFTALFAVSGPVLGGLYFHFETFFILKRRGFKVHKANFLVFLIYFIFWAWTLTKGLDFVENQMVDRQPAEYAKEVCNTFLVWYEGFATPAALFVQGTITIGYTCFPTAAFLHVPPKWGIVKKGLAYFVFCVFSFSYVAMAFYVSLLFNEFMYTFFPKDIGVTFYEDGKHKKGDHHEKKELKKELKKEEKKEVKKESTVKNDKKKSE